MFDHEKLDVYRLSLEFVAWAYIRCRSLIGADRHARDQLLRASQSIPLNIAESNGKPPSPDRIRSLRIALGSALECGAILDVLRACHVLSEVETLEGKRIVERIVAMLIRMTRNQPKMLDDVIDYSSASETPNQPSTHTNPR